MEKKEEKIMKREEIKLTDISGVLDDIFDRLIQVRDLMDDIEVEDSQLVDSIVEDLVDIGNYLGETIEGEYTNKDVIEKMKGKFRHDIVEKDCEKLVMPEEVNRLYNYLHENSEWDYDYKELFLITGRIAYARETHKRLCALISILHAFLFCVFEEDKWGRRDKDRDSERIQKYAGEFIEEYEKQIRKGI